MTEICVVVGAGSKPALVTNGAGLEPAPIKALTAYGGLYSLFGITYRPYVVVVVYVVVVLKRVAHVAIVHVHDPGHG